MFAILGSLKVTWTKKREKWRNKPKQRFMQRHIISWHASTFFAITCSLQTLILVIQKKTKRGNKDRQLCFNHFWSRRAKFWRNGFENAWKVKQAKTGGFRNPKPVDPIVCQIYEDVFECFYDISFGQRVLGGISHHFDHEKEFHHITTI